MKIKVELLHAFMRKYKLTSEELAEDMGVAVEAIDALLRGEAVDEAAARMFIYYFGATEAARMIDWAGIGKINPLGLGLGG